MKRLKQVWIAGAGLSGAVIARELADEGFEVTVFDKRKTVAGNCYTERDQQTGVLLHHYGPHIFHTNDEDVWNYVRKFTSFREYRHKVWTTVEQGVFPMPISLATINQFFSKTMKPNEAKDFIARSTVKIDDPSNFEEQALSMIGPDLYQTFFKGYTEKQWGIAPKELPASVLKRLPLRFDYNGEYFDHKFQGMPEDGYTPMVENILRHSNIEIKLSSELSGGSAPDGVHLFWSGPLDEYFSHKLGFLGYRTLDFEHQRLVGDFQGCAVMNYGDADVPQTRITEHKHFAPWETHSSTIITREFSRECKANDIPYYPIRLAKEKALLSDYVREAEILDNVTFVGRLGTYRYLDMDVCIREALNVSARFVEAISRGLKPPVFSTSPL